MKSESNLKNALLAFVLFTLPFSVFWFLIYHDILRSIALGAAGGFLFSFILTIAIIRFRKNLLKKAPYDCIHAVMANYLTKKEAIGGMLYLCEKELLFQAHNVNISKIKIRINYHDIKLIDYGRTPRSIKVQLTDMEEYIFIVNHKRKLKNRIDLLITN